MKQKCYDQLTSAAFHRQVSVRFLRSELAKRPNLDFVEKAIFLKHVFALEKGFELLNDVYQMDKNNIDSVAELIKIGAKKSSNASWFENFLKNLNREEFFIILRQIESPPQLVPVVESLITSVHIPKTAAEIGIVVHCGFKDEKIFQILIQAVLNCEEPIRSGIALRLVRGMGFAGLTHKTLLAHFAPIFSDFKNYQALSSVLLIAGGLSQEIVDLCMTNIRSDMAGGWRLAKVKPPSPEGHSQMIRRLVVCGYPKEAMELYSHFPAETFSSLTSKNEISQIYRLYLASFLWPDIVPMELVAPLRRETLMRAEDGFAGSSFIHALVVEALQRLQIEHVSEYIEPKTLLMIDVFVPSLNLAIEVQGPSHYIYDMESQQHVLRPEDSFKLQILKKIGLNVEELSVHGFGRNNATRNADNIIAQLVAKYAGHKKSN